VYYVRMVRATQISSSFSERQPISRCRAGSVGVGLGAQASSPADCQLVTLVVISRRGRLRSQHSLHPDVFEVVPIRIVVTIDIDSVDCAND